MVGHEDALDQYGSWANVLVETFQLSLNLLEDVMNCALRNCLVFSDSRSEQS